MKYNSAFFGTHEAYFAVLKKRYGERKALAFFTEVMQKNLKKAYDAVGFKKGNAKDFIRIINKRDKSVGLRVSLKIADGKIIYRFYTDPFPNLKGKVSASALDATYMAFKVSYLLGNPWSYKTKKHLWKGDKYTEHLISKK